MGPNFLKNLQNTLCFLSKNEPHEILNRIFSFEAFEAETQHLVQNRPWVPHARGQDDGSLHKFLQIIPRWVNRGKYGEFPADLLTPKKLVWNCFIVL